jgi:AraC-like DNA-binding protein
MPIKLKRKFESEYGKTKGDRIFYAWENKRKVQPAQLTIKGDKKYISHMYKHLLSEHPSTRSKMKMKGGY